MKRHGGLYGGFYRNPGNTFMMDDMAREDVFLFIQARKYGIDRQAKAVCQNICRYFWEEERNGPWFCGKAGKCVSEKE